jgi:FtsZ-interacting cell division protein ZipA
MEGNVDILGIVIILVLLAAAFWAKKKFFKSEMPKKVETFPGREVPSAKSSHPVASEAIASENKALDKDEADREPVQQPSVNIQQNDIESPQSTEIPPVKIINESGADTCEKIKAQIPEDSVLRRHYLAQLDAERELITNPYPTDSVLRRHYESMLATLAVQPTDSAEVSTEIVNITELPSEKQQLPEESTLRRHFLTQLMTEIESEVFPRPTDSILKRHYDSLILAKFADRLSEMSGYNH